MSRGNAPIISMADAVQALNITIDGVQPINTDVSNINVLCPNCSPNHTTKRKTLNIDFRQNVYGCPRCNFSGGVYNLVSYYTGWPLNTIKDHIRAGDLGNIKVDDEHRHVVAPSAEPTMASLERRNSVYNAMLDLMSLSETHKNDLLRRGISEEHIESNRFKSYPKYMDLSIIPKKLINNGYDLRGVPGFGLDENGAWAMVRLPDSGYLIPMRNGTGYIQGFQIRYDHPHDNIPKYSYFSSKRMEKGTGCEGWCSWSGMNVREATTPFDVVVTEGPLKGFIVHELTNANVIAVPGVSVLKKLPPVLKELNQLGLRKVVIAYDMDALSKVEVSNQLARMREMLDDLELPHQTLMWDQNYKGLDDWLLSQLAK
jgi:hypothetical protein